MQTIDHLIAESIVRSKEGGAKLDQVAEASRASTGSAAQVKGLIDEVVSGGQEQSLGIQQISQALTQIDGVTQKTVAYAEENAASGKESII